MAQVRRGNESAFEVIYDRHHGGILSFCRHMLGSRDEAEDALQQTFISAYADMQTDEREHPAQGLALRDRAQQAASRCCAPAAPTAPTRSRCATAGLSDEVQHRADLKEVLQDLQQLPEEQREALVLSELGDLSHAEVANVIGCRGGKVKSLVFQARSSLIENRDGARDPVRGDSRAALDPARRRPATRCRCAGT